MRKKTNGTLQLVLITSILASCAQSPKSETASGQKVYMRADSTAPYTEVTQEYQQQRSTGMGMGSMLLWYMAFRHMGGGLGYANRNIHPNSVAGTNMQKAKAYQTMRGGLGATAQQRNSASS